MRSPDHRVAVADPAPVINNVTSKVNLKASQSVGNMASRRLGRASHEAGGTPSSRVDNNRAGNNRVARAKARERRSRRLHLRSN